ncbi:MAG: hypothetical protein Q8N38_02245 [Bacteroidales bacterium]|nr:hypothetical protein [Bacteroidales bacterium]
MKRLFDDSVDSERFGMANVFSVVFGEGSYIGILKELESHFKPSIAKHILQSITRFSFYIEPVKQPKIESTKFAVRWSETLNYDPRQCSFEDCLAIFEKLIKELLSNITVEENINLLRIISNHTLIAYELNIDYITRIQHKSIHTIDNIGFFWGDVFNQVYSLRKYLLNPHNHSFIGFFSETYGKIAVKSFLTDRVLTGAHKTNREKRWECHPDSVHFALRKDCLAIEAKLINQICHFEGFPQELKELLTKDNVITFNDDVTRCPITLDPISFDKFHNEILHPTHGKSSFQVGHLHPLKSIEENAFSGHSKENISWISSEGNRIQGELSVHETRELIFRIISNYRSAGLID